MNDIVQKTSGEITPMQSPDRLIALAIEQNADVDKLEKLMQLQERWNANQAKIAFYKALSEFQEKCPSVIKSEAGYDNRYHYAPLDQITETIKGTMRICGLTYRWDQYEDGDKITVTCIITHVSGHSEKNSLTGAPDTSGSKNAIQSRGSTVQYLRRYTLESALGLSTTSTDNDGGKPIETIDEDQCADLIALADEVGADMGKFLRFMKIGTLKDLPKAKYDSAIKSLEKKRKAL